MTTVTATTVNPPVVVSQGTAVAPPAQVAPVTDLTGFMAQVQQSLQTAVQQAVAPLQVEITQLKKPQSQSGASPSQLFGGGAPVIRQGEDANTSRGYSFLRAIVAMSTRDFSNAKVEQEVHNKLMEIYGGNLGKGSVLVPLGGEHLHVEDSRYAQQVSQMVRQGVADYDPQELRYVIKQLFDRGAIKQDFSTLSDAAGGILLGPTEQGEMIELLRNKSILSMVGAREVTLPPNGRMSWPGHKTAGSGYWVGEAQNITESDMTFGNGVTLQAKKLAALVDLPNEMIRFITQSIEAFWRTEIAKTLALTQDSQFFSYDVGSALKPKGLLAYSGLLSHTASTAGTDGDTFEPQDVAKMVAKVEEQNISTENFQFVMRPLQWACIATRRGDAVTANDQKGPFVFRTEQGPDRLMGYRVGKTAQISNARTKGSGTALTQVLGGVFEEMLIGRVGAMEFAMDPYAGTGGANFKSDMTTLRAIMHTDMAPRRQNAFIVCDQLVNT